MVQSPGCSIATCLAGADMLVQTALEASANMLAAGESASNHADSSGPVASSHEAGRPRGWLLLESVCTALASDVPSSNNHPTAVQMINLMLQYQQLEKPPMFVAAVSAAAALEASEGNSSIHQLVMRHTSALQLTTQDVAVVHSAAVVHAILHASSLESDSCSESAQMWSGIQAMFKAAEAACAGSAVSLTAEAASQVSRLLQNQPMVAQHLLAKKLPLQVLQCLLQSAADSKHAASAHQLLQHAKQHDMLQCLSPVLLAVAVQCSNATAADSAAAAGKAMDQQLLAILLQQGQVPDVATVAALIRAASGSKEQWQQLLDWLQEQCSTAPVATAYSFLCRLLQASSSCVPGDNTWQLYELLQQCQGQQRTQSPWPAEQQGLPAEICSALIIQHSTVVPRVLQLWHDSKLASGDQLSSQAQKHLISALITAGELEEALGIVQQVPQQLLHLAQMLQQHAINPTDPQMVQLLRLAAQVDSSEAAAAAEVFLLLLQQKQATLQSDAAIRAIAVSLVLLCSRHKRLQGADILLKAYVLGTVDADAAAPAVAAFVTAAAPDSSKHSAAVGLFRALGRSMAGTYLPPALGYILSSQHPEPDAAALLLAMMQGSLGEQPLPMLLSQLQLEQLCAFISLQHSTAVHSSTGSASAVDGLPTPLQLAVQCVESDVSVSAAATALLINSLASDAPELQPAAAAVALGLVTEAQLAAISADSRHRTAAGVGQQGNDSSHQQAVKVVTKLIARLCYKQLFTATTTSGSIDADELARSLEGWVPRLSLEGAAAALFAAWYWAQPTAAPAANVHQTAVGVLCLELYQASRAGKPSLDTLLLDIGLAAAADAQQWAKGK